MASPRFAVVRLGKESLDDIRTVDRLVGSPASSLAITVTCTQVPGEVSPGTYVFIVLGSDNNKGIETAWKRGLRAFGKVHQKMGGPGYNDPWQVELDIDVVLPSSVNHDDFLAKSPTAYYWFSKIPVLGISSFANQTFQSIKFQDPQQDVRALMHAVATVHPGFKADVQQRHPELSGLFNYAPPAPDQRHAEMPSLFPHLDEQEATTDASAEKLEFLPAEWVLALASKGFLLVTGPSGTGKSRIGREIAVATDYAVEQKYSATQIASRPATNLAFVPVGADWTDDTPLLGYKNLFGSANSEQSNSDVRTSREVWELTPTLLLILRCLAKPEAPHFLILDEMNLSHVERYFGKFLSIMEANRGLSEAGKFLLLTPEDVALIAVTLQGHGHYPMEAEVAARLSGERSGLVLPDNLLIVGTVNVDETTYMFSPKVLDRAHVVEMGLPDPLAYLRRQLVDTASLLPTDDAVSILKRGISRTRTGYWEREAPLSRITESCATGPWSSAVDQIISAVERTLAGTQRLLAPVGFGFAYRSMNEVCSYVATYLECSDLTLFSTEGHAGWQAALDRAVFQKLLPRLHGNRRQLGECLVALERLFNGQPAQYTLGRSQVAVSETESIGFELPNSRKKISQMLLRLEATGHTTFVC